MARILYPIIDGQPPGAWYDPTCMGINWAAGTKQTLSWTNIAWDNIAWDSMAFD